MPRDLETICLRCLEKDPARRFATAKDLGDELGRFLRGETLVSRRAGPLDRGRRWCRRNPAVAALTVAVALALLTGTAISTYFAIESLRLAGEKSDLARDEEKARREAERRKKEAEDLAGQQQRLKTLAEADRDDARRSLYLADARGANQSAREGSLGQVEKTLLGHIPQVDRPDYRGWEWYYLLARSGAAVTKLRGHLAEVHAVAWSPDGRWLASAGGAKDGTVRLWDVSRGEPAQVWRSGAGVAHLCWSPDAKRLALGLGNGKTEIRAVASGAVEQTLNGSAPGWSANGKWLACATYKDEIRSVITVYDADSGAERATFPGPAHFRSLAWNPDNRRIAVLGLWQGSLCVAETGARLTTIPLPGNGGFTTSQLAWSPDGDDLAFGFGYLGDLLAVWNVPTNRTRTLAGHFGHVKGVCWSPDGTRLATAGADRLVHVWDAKTGKTTHSFDGHSEEVFAVSWHPDGNTIASGGRDGIVGLWGLGAARSRAHDRSAHADRDRAPPRLESRQPPSRAGAGGQDFHLERRDRQRNAGRAIRSDHRRGGVAPGQAPGGHPRERCARSVGFRNRRKQRPHPGGELRQDGLEPRRQVHGRLEFPARGQPHRY